MLLCLALLFGLNVPLFLNGILPMHDTVYTYHIFSFFYNDALIHHSLPLWMPFGLFGMQSDYYLITALSASQHLAGALGLLLGVTNIFALYKFSLLLEQLVFLVGVWVLARRLFRERATVLAVTIAATLSQFLLEQIWFDFRIYSYLPLALFFVVRYFDDYRPRHLLFALLTLVVSLYGISYMAPVPALSLLVVALVLAGAHFRNLRRALDVPRREAVLSAALGGAFVFFFVNHYRFLSDSLAQADTFAQGRDRASMATEIGKFLTYGGNIGFRKFAEILLPTDALIDAPWDISLFAGLIPLVFIVYALVKRIRDARFVGFGAAAVVFAVFSLGEATPLAALLYKYFPMMKYYRHIGLTVGHFKLYLPLLAGFGLDRFLVVARTDAVAFKRELRIVTGIGALFLAAYLAGLALEHRQFGVTAAYLLIPCGLAVLMAGLWWAGRRPAGPGGAHAALVVACVILELSIHQGFVYLRFSPRSAPMKPITAAVAEASDYPFQMRRHANPSNQREAEKTRFVVGTTAYAPAFNYMQWDPCLTPLRITFMQKNMMDFLRARGATIDIFVSLPFERETYAALACESPKLRLVAEAVYVDTREEALEAVRRARDLTGRTIIGGAPAALRAGRATLSAAGEEFPVTVLDFKPNELSFDLVAPAAGWVSYAEAWNPSWKAEVNGKAAFVAEANAAFMAVPVERGHNVVKLTFRNPASLRRAYVTIGASVLFMGALLLFVGREALFRRDAE